MIVPFNEKVLIEGEEEAGAVLKAELLNERLNGMLKRTNRNPCRQFRLVCREDSIQLRVSGGDGIDDDRLFLLREVPSHNRVVDPLKVEVGDQLLPDARCLPDSAVVEYLAPYATCQGSAEVVREARAGQEDLPSDLCGHRQPLSWIMTEYGRSGRWQHTRRAVPVSARAARRR